MTHVTQSQGHASTGSGWSKITVHVAVDIFTSSRRMWWWTRGRNNKETETTIFVFCAHAYGTLTEI